MENGNYYIRIGCIYMWGILGFRVWRGFKALSALRKAMAWLGCDYPDPQKDLKIRSPRTIGGII